jgi:hypothetical protein
MVGWIILSLTLACFVGMGVLALLWSRKYELPKGERMEGRYQDMKVTLVYDKGVLPFSPQITANSAALASWVTFQVWREKGVSPEPWVVVHVADDANYDKLYDAPLRQGDPSFKGSNGMLLWAGKKIGSGALPKVCCRASKFGPTPLTGSLVVHELTHCYHQKAFGGTNPSHDDASIWGQPNSMEGRAFTLYMTHRHEVGVSVTTTT